MPLSDYSHWNEEAPRIWWEEEGKHEPREWEPEDDEFRHDYDYDEIEEEEDEDEDS